MVFTRPGTPPDRAPAPASTVVLLRPGPVQPEVFLLRRSEDSRFFGGAFVFPGGRVDPADRDPAIPGLEALPDAQRARFLPAPGGDAHPEEDDRAAWAAGAREAFEEAGVLLARGARLAEAARDRAAVHAGRLTLRALLERHGLRLEPEAMVPWARWITPSRERRRFDARFFVAALPEGQIAEADETETSDGTWLTARAALSRHARREVFLPPPTRRILEELAALPGGGLGAGVASVLAALRDRPVYPVLPRVELGEDTIRIHLPHGPEYDRLDGEGLALPADAPERRFDPVLEVPMGARPPVAGEPPEEARALLHFWCGDALDRVEAPPEVAKRWWIQDPEFDAELARRFGGLHRRAEAGELDGWAETPLGAAALVVLLDQLSRNLGRGSPAAFANDARALELARVAVERGDDRAVPPMVRTWFYMPFMHAEDLDAQDACRLAFERMAEEGLPVQGHLRACDEHRAPIARFGRFPYRNQALGRVSTPEEERFLSERSGRSG